MFTVEEKEQKAVATINFNNPEEYKVIKLKRDGKNHCVHQILAERLVNDKKAEYVNKKIQETKIPNLKK